MLSICLGTCRRGLWPRLGSGKTCRRGFQPRLGSGKMPLLLCVLFALPAAPAYAHKLNVFATAEGKTIHGKAYFHGGAPAQDVAVTALSPTGQPIGQTRTDGEGRFTLEARFHCDYRFLVETGDGHGGEYTLTAAALPEDLPVLPLHGNGKTDDDTGRLRAERTPAAPQSASVIPADGQGQVLHELAILRAEVGRLEEQLHAYEDRLRLTDILGGIGYIAGLTGAAYYYLGVRRKRAGS
jgi:nickel transport protein